MQTRVEKIVGVVVALRASALMAEIPQASPLAAAPSDRAASLIGGEPLAKTCDGLCMWSQKLSL